MQNINITWHIEKRNIADLKNWSRNPRKISKEDYQKLIERIKERGLHDILKIDENNVVLSGNQRLKAIKELGFSDVDVMIADRVLTDEEKDKIAIESNLNDGVFDEEILKEEFREELLEEVGFKEDLTAIFGKSDEVQEDEVPEIKEGETICKSGDVWELGRHRLVCGDCTDEGVVRLLMGERKADMVFTDPPYGLGGYGGRNKMELQGDDQNVSKFYHAIPDVREIYVWGRVQNLVDLNFVPRDIIIWKKNNFGLGKGYRGQYEVCFYKGDFSGSDSDVWEIDKDINYVHPIQKPVGLCVRAIKNSNPQLILDLFLGSGSTLIACEQSNRICFGCEISEKYCDVIVRRYINYMINNGKESEIVVKRNGESVDFKVLIE